MVMYLDLGGWHSPFYSQRREMMSKVAVFGGFVLRPGFVASVVSGGVEGSFFLSSDIMGEGYEGERLDVIALEARDALGITGTDEGWVRVDISGSDVEVGGPSLVRAEYVLNLHADSFIAYEAKGYSEFAPTMLAMFAYPER
jgi:hypothetical protein